MDKTSIKDFLKDWPGKSVIGGEHYPATCHMLDVAAVAEILVRRTLFSNEQKQAIVYLTALHDLGKFSTSFRNMIEGLTRTGGASHWELTECLLDKFDEILLGPKMGGRESSRRKLYASTAGHHGKPPNKTFDRMQPFIGDDALPAAEQFLVYCSSQWPNASLRDLKSNDILALSWWLPGFVTVCDWLGSNIDWFPPVACGNNLDDHLRCSRERAEIAVQKSGLSYGEVLDKQLYDFSLRPMQEVAKSIELPSGPCLAIIEDETGAGKTEAAMLLAQRMLVANKGNGIFFALPTMATSNAMFTRAEETVGKLFTNPSLTLAHGRANLNHRFKDLKGRESGDEEDVTCAPWLADGRRRALLAQVGVGTIDQALLAILPTKHNCLRIWGLSQKILIVDEVHELGNPYMEVELCTLLKSHAMQGGSAILLSATLPLGLRQKLAFAFELGAGRIVPQLHSQAYPSLNIVGGKVMSNLREVKNLRGKIAVQRIAEATEAAKVLVDAAANGASCVWVRNSVDDAIAAKVMLEEMGVTPMLFHARFAFGDRQKMETDVLREFGRDRNNNVGRILVATQVVESSLDLDFDVMISDLAPMAALIQRAGRLWRHMDRRPAHGRPVARPVLHVLSADPRNVSSERWLKDVLGKGEFVYSVAEQWRTANALFKVGEIAAPHNLRNLVEAVHGNNCIAVPDALVQAELKAEGEYYAQRNRGQQNAIDLTLDYRGGGAGHDDVNYPTRLGPEQRTLMLVKRVGKELQLWCGKGAEGEMHSEVSASKHRLDKFSLPQAGDEREALQFFKKDWPEWKKRSVTVVEVMGRDTLRDNLKYSTACGLMI